MDYASSSIRSAIVHRVHHKKVKGVNQTRPPMLADFVSALHQESTVFLNAHILRSLGDQHARRAKFKTPESNSLRAMCEAMFAHPDDETVFVQQSREIATALFAAAQGKEYSDGRISAGDLVVCLVDCNSDAGTAVTLLALMKIEPKNGFATVEQRDASERVRIDLQWVGNILTESRLQKCAFVLPSADGQLKGYDLTVLDLETDSRNTNRWVASYFVDKFLQCEAGLNLDEKLRVFIYDGGDWFDQQAWTDADKERAKERAISVTFDNFIDVVAFADQVIPTTGERDSYLAHLQSKGLDDLIFEPDPKRRRQIADYVTYEGDNDLTARFKRADYGRGRTVDPGDGQRTDGVHQITITTALWRQRRPGQR